jgi:hypothetical protein
VKVLRSRVLNLLRLRTCDASRFESGHQLLLKSWLGEVLFLKRNASDVRYQTRDTVGLDLGTELRHFPSTLGDHFSERRVGLALNFVGSQILGFHGFAGRRTTAAIVRMTQRAVRLEDFCGVGLGLCAGRGQTTQEACSDDVQNLLSHTPTNVFSWPGGR